MVNFPNPQDDVATPAQVQASMSIMKFWHAVGSLYIWEYFITLEYEWKVIRRCLPYRWTIWIYSFSRFSALLSIVLFFVNFNVTNPINCKLLMIFATLLLCLSSITASLLMVIRTIAIWNRNKFVIALAMVVWGTSIGFHLHSFLLLITRVHMKWISSELACETFGSGSSILGFIPTIVADMALNLIIFAGLFVLRRNGGAAFGLSRLLWRQGVIWLVLASIIEILTLVFTFLHLNGPLESLFEVPSLILMTISVSRMHRSLVDFASGPTEVTHENPKLSQLVFSKAKRADTAASTLGQVRMSMNGAFEQHSTGSKNDGDSSTVLGTSENIPQVTGGPSESTLDLTQASAYSLPTVSPSPVLEAESV